MRKSVNHYQGLNLKNTIAYQGYQGAYSHLACKNAFPNMRAIACESFLDAMMMVEKDKAKIAMIPLENSTAGRVEEIYRLIPKMSLYVIGEHFEPVRHCLLGLSNGTIDDLEFVLSHPQALAQCQNHINKFKLKAVAKLDTAGSAKEIKQKNDKKYGAIASSLASDIYGLKILKDNFEDIPGNITRFFVLSKEKIIPAFDANKTYITSVLFQVRDIPAALYKALGGFATNGVNLKKLESYSLDGGLPVSHFHIDIYGHTEQKSMRLALEELSFFAQKIKILGVYKKYTNTNTNEENNLYK